MIMIIMKKKLLSFHLSHMLKTKILNKMNHHNNKSLMDLHKVHFMLQMAKSSTITLNSLTILIHLKMKMRIMWLMYNHNQI